MTHLERKPPKAGDIGPCLKCDRISPSRFAIQVGPLPGLIEEASDMPYYFCRWHWGAWNRQENRRSLTITIQGTAQTQEGSQS